MIATNQINEITFDSSYLYLKIGEQKVKVRLSKASEKLKSAGVTEREYFVISPSGYGIHWPLLDEDLSIEGLLKISEEVS